MPNYLVSYPKSGRTWIRFILGKIVCLKHNLSDGNILKTNFLSSKEPGIVLNDNYTHEDSMLSGSKQLNRFQLQKDKSRYNYSNVILLIRDPRDVVVSFYYHYCFRSKYKFEGEIKDFILNDSLGIGKTVDYYNIWYDSFFKPNKTLLVKYEDLHKNTSFIVKSIVGFLGIKDVSDGLIKEAIDFCSFDNMKRFEQDNSFGRRYLRRIDKNDIRTYKIREGKLSGYLEHVKPEDISFLDDSFKETKFYSLKNKTFYNTKIYGGSNGVDSEARMTFLKNIFDISGNKLKVLDIGCAEGMLCHYYKDYIDTYHGFDFNMNSLIVAGRVLSLNMSGKEYSLNKCNFDNRKEFSSIIPKLLKKYDIVFFLGIYHHLNPKTRDWVLRHFLQLSNRWFAIRIPKKEHSWVGLFNIIKDFGYELAFQEPQFKDQFGVTVGDGYIFKLKY